jgi:hypothetical protein
MPWFFSIVGCLCLLFALIFTLYRETHTITYTDPPPLPPPPGVTPKTVTKTESFPHPANWGAAEGFAMAGGICLVAAALVKRRP